MKFSIKDFFTFTVKQETVHLVTFTEEILNGKLHFLCSRLCHTIPIFMTIHDPIFTTINPITLTFVSQPTRMLYSLIQWKQRMTG